MDYAKSVHITEITHPVMRHLVDMRQVENEKSFTAYFNLNLFPGNKADIATLAGVIGFSQLARNGVSHEKASNCIRPVLIQTLKELSVEEDNWNIMGNEQEVAEFRSRLFSSPLQTQNYMVDRLKINERPSARFLAICGNDATVVTNDINDIIGNEDYASATIIDALALKCIIDKKYTSHIFQVDLDK